MMNNYTEIFCLALSDFSRGEVSCQIVLEEVLDIWIVQYFLHYSSKQRNWRGQSFTTSVVSQYHEIAQHKRLSHSNFKLGAKIELVKVSSPTEEQVTHCLKITQNVSFELSYQNLHSFSLHQKGRILAYLVLIHLKNGPKFTFRVIFILCE